MPNWFDKTDEEIIQRLKNVLRTDDFQFIGKYEPVPQKDFGFFKDVRSLSGVRKFYPKDDGSTDEKKLRPLEIYTKAYDKLVADKWCKFYAVPAALPLRKSKRNPFLLQTDWKRVRDIFLLKGAELIENIKNDALNTPEGIAGNLMRAIETISIDINTEPTTFIFELIQNADDNPNSENNVSITFQIDNSHLIIKHNGSNFEVNNTVALCGVNEGDKREDTNKIGFKGIGFKSIFKDANFAYIKSGDFSFRFDEEFWKQQGIELFWHITPINTPVADFKQVLKTESNVNIVIRPRVLHALKTYRDTFVTHFNDERILLFLRNVKSLIFYSSEEKFEITNSSSKWKIFTESTVEIPVNETNELNRRINFPDKRIPVKFHGITLTELGFGFRINQNKVELIGDGFIYAYLPTKVNLGFSFILNGNFIPDASRTKIYSDLTWNLFLFEKAGELFVKQIISLLNEGLNKQSVLNQIPCFTEILLNIKDDDKIIFINCFKRGFEKEILNQHFVPNSTDNLEPLSNIVIDETGLADLLKEDFFKLTGITGKLIHNEVGEGIEKVKALITEYKQGVVYAIEDLKVDLKTTEFQEWLKIPTNNFKLIQYFSIKTELQRLLETEKIFLSESNQLNKSSSLFNYIPDELTFLPTEKLNSTVLNLLAQNNILVTLTEFEPVQFFKDNILGKQKSINAALTDETNLLNFWKFIFDNWNLFESDPLIKDSLKHFEVLCKSKAEIELSKKVISFAYLSAEFNSANEIESIVKDISPDAVFISHKYIDKHREAEKWRKIFKQAAAITDLQKVIEVLLPKLSTIEVVKHFEIAKQIFRFWKDPANKLTDTQVGLIKTNLKIKCIDEEFRRSTECFISDHYNNNQLIASWLPNIELPTQIAQDYAPRTNQVSEWKNFLSLIGCVELPDKQNVFDTKLDFIIASQDELQEKHFELMKCISGLYKAKTENGLNFDFQNALSQIKLQTNNEEWHLPNRIHFSDSYKPKLRLQNDQTVNSTQLFLNEKYLPLVIEKSLLDEIGVHSNFSIKKIDSQLLRDVLELEYKQFIEKDSKYIADKNGLLRNWSYGYKIESVTYVLNHYKLNYPFLLSNVIYYDLFIEYISKKSNYDFLILKTDLSIWKNRKFPQKTFIYYIINSQMNFGTVAETRDKPSNLYSKKLTNYISDKSKIPQIDFSDIIITEDGLSLEEAIGIKQLLSKEQCIELLCRTNSRITHEEIKQLQLIKILSDYQPSDEEMGRLFLLNQNLEWKPLNKLFISKDEQFQIKSSQNLYEDFISIAANFGIQELSENNLVLTTKPQTIAVTDEIEIFFKSKAKYIAFKIDQSNYEEVTADILEMITPFEFYEFTSIAKVFPEDSPIYKIEIDFHFNKNDNKILYTGNWKTNKTVIDFLFNQISSEKVERIWFENVVNRWDNKKIAETLIDMFGSVPPEWIESRIEEKPDKKPELTINTFQEEVEDFILTELENTEWSEYIPELKNILELSISHPKEKQKLYNLIAKLKLAKHRNIQFEKASKDFNQLENENEKYFVHSARGSFAYIHTNEILRMKSDGYMMALDFGAKSKIKIYETAEEILHLNTNHILAYQYEKTFEDLISFCEANKDANKHLLILDRDNSRVKSMELFKLLNPEDDYQ